MGDAGSGLESELQAEAIGDQGQHMSLPRVSGGGRVSRQRSQAFPKLKGKATDKISTVKQQEPIGQLRRSLWHWCANQLGIWWPCGRQLATGNTPSMGVVELE